MAEENKSTDSRPADNEYPPALVPVGLIMLFFGGCAILIPNFVVESLTGAAVSLLALSLYNRSEMPVRSRENGGSQSAVSSAVRTQLMDAMQFPAFLLDRKGNVLYFNQASKTAFGTVGKGDKITIRFRQPEFKAHVETALNNLDPVTFPYNEAVPNDRWFDVELSPVSSVDPGTKLADTLFLLAFHDQTDVRRMDKMRSDFIANASHELRTPLSSILGFVETIRGPAKNDPKSIDRFTGVMLEQAERMSRLVNDLLSLSQIEMKSHVRPSGNVSLQEVLTSVVEGLESSAKATGVEIEMDFEGDLIVNGDRDGLIQVFENLAENACKYGQDGGRVIISVKEVSVGATPYARVCVKDFGPGIPLEHQHRITERFYRVDVARSREKQGTGLGLAIVKNILQRHGSRLQISSEPGEGAEFTVDLELSSVEK